MSIYTTLGLSPKMGLVTLGSARQRISRVGSTTILTTANLETSHEAIATDLNANGNTIKTRQIAIKDAN
jgi:hypothetical protein